MQPAAGQVQEMEAFAINSSQSTRNCSRPLLRRFELGRRAPEPVDAAMDTVLDEMAMDLVGNQIVYPKIYTYDGKMTPCWATVSDDDSIVS
jgi:hypothetical protein